RSISRIKSSLRHEVTISNLVFRCREFGGVTSGASGTTRASDSAQDPLPPPPSPTPNPDDQSPGLAASGSSKTATTTAYTAWTTTTSRFEPSASSIPEAYLCMKSQNLQLRIWCLMMKISAIGTSLELI
ncbi:hypothetical protein Tco_0376099, partial [Tanacetum coccineum]